MERYLLWRQPITVYRALLLDPVALDQALRSALPADYPHLHHIEVSSTDQDPGAPGTAMVVFGAPRKP